MLPRQVIPLPEDVYPRDPWRLVETRFDAEHLDRAETVFSQANGFVGFRGTFDEGRPSHLPGTFVNGFHETWPIEHAEEAYGLARTGQTIVNVPDATVIELYVDDEPLYLPFARMPEYERVLDMRTGVLTRFLHWSTPSGKHVEVRSRRLVSFEHRHLAAIEYEVVVLDQGCAGGVGLQGRQPSGRDGGRASGGRRGRRGGPTSGHGRSTSGCWLRACVSGPTDRFLQGYRTARSGMRLGMGVDHVIETTPPATRWTTTRTKTSAAGAHRRRAARRPHPPDEVRRLPVVAERPPASSSRGASAPWTGRCAAGSTRSSPRSARTSSASGTAPTSRSRQVASAHSSSRRSAGTSSSSRRRHWRAEGTGIPAKGLTGQAYEGHYFWDTEIYVLPFLTYTLPADRAQPPAVPPQHARPRPGARRRAQPRGRAVPLAHDQRRGGVGVLPGRAPRSTTSTPTSSMRSASTSTSAATDFHLSRSVRRCSSRPPGCGRTWASTTPDGCFHIHSVTGPDEYTTVVNDNTFTNLMARLNLNWAAAR
jgi:alpha,alpha-trehalose phosphorylase